MGMRQGYLMGLNMKKRLIIDNDLLQREYFDIQIDAYSSTRSRTIQTFKAMQQGLADEDLKNDISSSAYTSMSHQRKLKFGRFKIPLVDRANSSLQQIYNENETVQGVTFMIDRYLQGLVFMKSAGEQFEHKAKFDFFTCENNKWRHIDISNPSADAKQNDMAFDYFINLGIVDKLSKLSNLTKEEIQQRGFRYLYDQSLYFTQIKQSQPDAYAVFTPREWYQLHKIIATFQFTTVDLKSRNYYQAVNLRHIAISMQNKIDCLLSLQTTSQFDPRNNRDYYKPCLVNITSPNYELQSSHDINLLIFANAFGLEIGYWQMDFTTSVIMELYYNTEKAQCDQCQGEECFEIKISIDKVQLFSELGFCDFKENTCPYLAFKNFVYKTYYKSRQEYENQCKEKYDSIEIENLRVWNT
ncbi:UNKNOWN [Stylonychia lemnae]|uniref:Uncharacterized protein n=1 Tax=Stylonychia lemnae TaxID=5949 RepID=A0A078AMJ7_STYLE|nr:UNKNOWN [Stylonychia lemnae]|eukprot:CDW83374.1 UNKNOWN [Stylonychia lemnae]